MRPFGNGCIASPAPPPVEGGLESTLAALPAGGVAIGGLVAEAASGPGCGKFCEGWSGLPKVSVKRGCCGGVAEKSALDGTVNSLFSP